VKLEATEIKRYKMLNMKTVREAHSLTLKTLHGITGLSPQYINDLENGKRTCPQKTYELLKTALQFKGSKK
jgi:transcriptional regulator with XRE-family HTH domain